MSEVVPGESFIEKMGMSPHGTTPQVRKPHAVAGAYFLLADFPNFGVQPYVTGYTVAELEAMYDASEEVVGNYQFTVTGDPEAGEDTIQCQRDDSSVTVRVFIELLVYDVDIVEAMD